MGSSRLPGKTTKLILGRPMIERMIERVRQSRYIGQTVVATSTSGEDDELEALAARIGVGCFRGSPDDVLERVDSAAASTSADLVVELLGDNPLVHADLIDDVIEFHRAGGHDYSASVTTEYPHAGTEVRKFPVGVRVQVFSPAVLHRSALEARSAYHRENSTTYIYEHPDVFRLGYVEARGKWDRLCRPELTFAVNYQENLDLVSRIFERCYPANSNFTLFDAVRAYDADPALQPLMGNR
jgi:spore coat polysaccharide biosynthesis protein SpsF